MEEKFKAFGAALFSEVIYEKAIAEDYLASEDFKNQNHLIEIKNTYIQKLTSFLFWIIWYIMNQIDYITNKLGNSFFVLPYETFIHLKIKIDFLFIILNDIRCYIAWLSYRMSLSQETIHLNLIIVLLEVLNVLFVSYV